VITLDIYRAGKLVEMHTAGDVLGMLRLLSVWYVREQLEIPGTKFIVRNMNKTVTGRSEHEEGPTH